MEFHTTRHYLNRLHIIHYALILVSIAVFMYLYMQPYSEPLVQHNELLAIAFLFIMLSDWVVAIVITSQLLKRANQSVSLYEKLKRYFSISIIRAAVFAMSSLLAAAGLYLTHHILFSGAFLINLLVIVFFWPTSARLGDELKLTASEREVLLGRR